MRHKRKWTWLRYRKGDHAYNLLCAAQHWLHENGGDALVIGGIGIMDQGPHKFQICIGVLGKRPERKNK